MTVSRSGGDVFARGTADVAVGNNRTRDRAGNGKFRSARGQPPRFEESVEETITSQANGMCFPHKAVSLEARYMPTTFNVIFLGNHASIDPTEGNNTAENGGALANTTFGSTGDPLYIRVQTLTPGANGFSGGAASAYDTNNNLATDQFRIDGRADKNFDAIAVYDSTITYADGSTATISAWCFRTRQAAGRPTPKRPKAIGLKLCGHSHSYPVAPLAPVASQATIQSPALQMMKPSTGDLATIPSTAAPATTPSTAGTVPTPCWIERGTARFMAGRAMDCPSASAGGQLAPACLSQLTWRFLLRSLATNRLMG